MPLVRSSGKHPREQSQVDMDFGEVIAWGAVSSLGPRVQVLAGMSRVSLLMRASVEPAAGLGIQRQARPARGARTLDMRLSGGALPDGRQKPDAPLRRR
jgi:hypothetical protein